MFNAQCNLVNLILFVTFVFFPNNVSARRLANIIRDLSDATQLIKAEWTVPLDGGRTCTNNSFCTDTLSEPPLNSTLQYLAIGRGTITYTCANRSAVQQPLYVAQNAFLYDASSLIPKFSSEDQFHSYIPRFLDYDYTSLDNSSLTCIGNIQRIDGLTIFNIFKIATFAVRVSEVVNSPNDPHFDIQWAHSQDENRDWDIYRVETARGGPPYDCGDQIISDVIPVEYTAEYWLYHKNSEIW